MSGGPLLKVTEGSTTTRVIAAVAGAALFVVLASWGVRALGGAQADAAQVQEALAVTAQLARSAAKGEPVAAALAEARSHAAVTWAAVNTQGGEDEFGIAQDAQLHIDGAEASSATGRAAANHARSLGAAAAELARRGGQLRISRLVITDNSGATLVGLPFRPEKSASKPAGVAVVGVAPTRLAPSLAMWVWALLVLIAPLFLGLIRVQALPKWFAGVLAMMPALALTYLACPTLTPATGSLSIVQASLLFPHEAAVVPLPLQQAPLWLAAALVLLAVTIGALLESVAWLLKSFREDPAPYLYIGPAVIATGVLVFVPFAVGVGLAFADRTGGFVGVNNYIEVIRSLADEAAATHFWRTLGHTVLWTVSNVTLHVTIGLALAIVLNQSNLRGRKIYRLLLIVPWAVPNYITALTWKWLFNTQYGPINAMLSALGVGGVDWLGQDPATNFLANVATNVWLGFPFMMVISLGALQSIPSDLYEAASIDGASAWQKFVHITLPLLRPALFPAVILGTIWTFNAFNVIYLVSGGGPDHQTEILITEAYYLFTVLRRIGLAAAYSVLIFVLLLAYTLITNKLTSATEAVDR